MNLTAKQTVLPQALSLVVSIIITTLLLFPRNFPYLGLSLSFFAFYAFTYAFLAKKTRISGLFLLVGAIFCFFLVYRANPLLTVLNITAIVYFYSFLALRLVPARWTLNTVIFAPLILLIRIFEQPNLYPVRKMFNFMSERAREMYATKQRSCMNLVLSLTIAIVIGIVISALLASTNPVFSSWFDRFIKLFSFDPEVLWKFLGDFGVTIVKWTIRIFAIAVSTFFLLRVASFVSHPEPTETVVTNKALDKIDDYLVIAKVVTAVILVAFFVSQLKIYTADLPTLESLGYSFAKYNREVFFQLIVVALILFVLLFRSRLKSIADKLLFLLLSIEGLFLSFIAVKAVFDYAETWGFTTKRLYGYSISLLLATIFVVFIFYAVKRSSKALLVSGIVTLVSLQLILVTIANFDYLIYHVKQPHTHVGTDYVYMSKLSTDMDSLSVYRRDLEGRLTEETCKDPGVRLPIEESFNNIDKKLYKIAVAYGVRKDLRTYNISTGNEYKALRLIKPDMTEEFLKGNLNSSILVVMNSYFETPSVDEICSQYEKEPKVTLKDYRGLKQNMIVKGTYTLYSGPNGYSDDNEFISKLDNSSFAIPDIDEGWLQFSVYDERGNFAINPERVWIEKEDLIREEITITNPTD